MGKHGSPVDTVVDRFDLSDEAVPLVQDLWEDFSTDGDLEPETVDRLKHVGISAVHGLVVALVMACWPVIQDAVLGGNLDLPSLAESLRVAVIAAFVSYFRPKR